MPFNPESLANLRPCKKGETHNPHGRPPSFRSLMKKVPKNMQAKVLDVLWTAISMPTRKAAAAYLKDKEEELPECGFMFEVVVKGLMSRQGHFFLMDILDRLIGKPKQVQEFTGELNLTEKPRIEFGEDASDIEPQPEEEGEEE